MASPIWPYLAGFIIMGMKGLYHANWLGESPAASPIGSQLGEWETRKSGNLPPLHYRYEVNTGFGRFSWLCPGRTVTWHTTPPPLLVAQLLNSSADPGKITSNCLFQYYVSHILVKHRKIILLLKLTANLKNRVSRFYTLVLVSWVTYVGVVVELFINV